MNGLVWARPEALALLLLLPVILLSALIFGAGKRGFQRGAIAWRLTVAALLIVGLAEPMLASSTGAGGVVFAIDRSSSVDRESQDAAERWLNDALAAAPGDRRAAIVSFGAQPLLTTPGQPAKWHVRCDGAATAAAARTAVCAEDAAGRTGASRCS